MEQYIVRRKDFVYQGKPYAVGDVWEPTGHRNDKAIIAARLVVPTDAQEPAKPARGRKVPT